MVRVSRLKSTHELTSGFLNVLLIIFVMQTINFFRLASKLCLVDLPGYGFAFAKDEVKDAWEELVSMLRQTLSDFYLDFFFN